MNDMQPDHSQTMPPNETDREGAMAKADLYKLANYSLKLFKKVQDEDQLEAWVQAKITKAADYIASVYHYLEYEMKFSEYGEHLANAEVYNEGTKVAIANKLMEAKEKVKELKKLQAEKLNKDKKAKVEEGILSGGERPCTECGGTGMVYEEPKAVPAHVQSKVDKYKRLVKATKAAHKRMDANNNGIPDADEGKEVDEDFESLKKTGDTTKTSRGNTVTKTATGIKHERPSSSYDDGGDELDSMAKSGKGTKSHAKAQSAAEKKDRAPALKKSKSGTWGMEGGEKFDNRKKEEGVEEGQGSVFGQGVYEGKKKGELKGNQKKLDADNDGDIEADDLADLRSGKKVDEAAPSAGMSKKEKSSTVKAAKAGKDIGKPGKNFDKVAKAAGGGEKGEKIAAAAMWKNKAKSLKESLDSMSDVQLDEEALDQSLDALINKAAQTDPQGLQTAAQSGPQALKEYLDRFLQSVEQHADQSAQPAPTATAPEATPAPTATAPAEPAPLAESVEINRLKMLSGL